MYCNFLTRDLCADCLLAKILMHKQSHVVKCQIRVAGDVGIGQWRREDGGLQLIPARFVLEELQGNYGEGEGSKSAQAFFLVAISGGVSNSTESSGFDAGVDFVRLLRRHGLSFTWNDASKPKETEI
ncbi:hypothetical protein U1Q18_001680 [Sarracenia purpurea var. burkii]